MNDESYHIKKRFPEKSDTIALLLVADPKFREICIDYDTCVKALHYWTHSKEREASARIDEYRILVQELEVEIAEVLEAANPYRLE